jgi:site-specific recombinase XerD
LVDILLNMGYNIISYIQKIYKQTMSKNLKAKRGRVAYHEFLSDAQLDKLFLYTHERANLARQKGTTRPIVDELIILLLVNTGLRAHELCNLNIADLPQSHGKNVILIRDVKGNITRSIDITPEMINCIARFVRLYREGAKPDEPLFISERGNRLSYMSLYNKVKTIGERAGIGKLHPNMLRLTFIVNLYNAERDLRFVQKQAGHANRKTTAMYIRADFNKEQKEETVSHGLLQHIEMCEACGKSISRENGTKIDSGQILCDDCLYELRNSY